jgi:RNA polymerase sigma-70 factor, ECF subfamily
MAALRPHDLRMEARRGVSGQAGVSDLVRRARDPRGPIRDRHAAFATLVKRFEQMAFATAVRASRDIEAARDACQEAFLEAWRLLPRLREPAAFGGWLERLVRTRCARARRRRAEIPESVAGVPAVPSMDGDPAELSGRLETVRAIRRAVAALPAREREAVTLVYFLGEPLRVVARALGVSIGNAGTLVYSARLRLRRRLPRAIAEAFLDVAATPAFTTRLRAGVFDEFVGEYRFAERPQHTVILRREQGVLASYAGGQRSVLVSRTADVLTTTAFDGEGRFGRDRRGRISHFVYYEFGRRIGVARKISARASRAT